MMPTKLEFKEIQITAMPQIEVEKMLNVLMLRKQKCYSQFELSFLMGQHDFYVRDAEDLQHTLIYAIPFTNVFRQIFNCDVEHIVPNIHTTPSYQVRISQAADKNNDIIYRAEKKIDGEDWELIAEFGTEEKDLQLALPESTVFVSEQKIKEWVQQKIETGYFDAARNALQIFEDCNTELDGIVRPLFLAKALKSFNGTKGLPKIDKKKDGNARFVYARENKDNP